ncbi:MAG TPA: YkvA family protein [Lacunisphaera sp.]
MKTIPSAALGRYLSQKPGAGQHTSPTTYVVNGANTVSPADLAGLLGLLPEARKKAGLITDSTRFKQRLELLVRYFEETAAEGGTAERRETAFALFYFLKGFDLIPDALPEIGLLDDALLVETVCHRNQLALRSHEVAQGRPWPENP